jgi:hypothetical protein
MEAARGARVQASKPSGPRAPKSFSARRLAWAPSLRRRRVSSAQRAEPSICGVSDRHRFSCWRPRNPPWSTSLDLKSPDLVRSRRATWSWSLPPSCREPFRAPAHQEWLTGDGPHPAVETEPSPRQGEQRRSRRPCHPRAICSGHQRYPADTTVTSRSLVPYDTPVTSGGGEVRNCMACKWSQGHPRRLVGGRWS